MGGKEEVVKTGGDNTFIEEMGLNVSEGEGELDEAGEVGKMLDEEVGELDEAGELGKLLDEEVAQADILSRNKVFFHQRCGG